MAENLNALAHVLVVALDRLQASAPAVESVGLVVAWFGDDLRAGHCRVRPPGSPADKSAAAAAQVAAFFGSAQPSDFAVSGESIS